MKTDEVSLKEYFDTRLNNIQNNTELARVGMEKRLESMNEFRAQLKDQTATFLTRDMYESRHQALQAQLDNLRDRVNAYENKGQGIKMSWLAMVGIVAFLATVATLILNATRLFGSGS